MSLIGRKKDFNVTFFSIFLFFYSVWLSLSILNTVSQNWKDVNEAVRKEMLYWVSFIAFYSLGLENNDDDDDDDDDEYKWKGEKKKL